MSDISTIAETISKEGTKLLELFRDHDNAITNDLFQSGLSHIIAGLKDLAIVALMDELSELKNTMESLQ